LCEKGLLKSFKNLFLMSIPAQPRVCFYETFLFVPPDRLPAGSAVGVNWDTASGKRANNVLVMNH
jgi:hypothetical protein